VAALQFLPETSVSHTVTPRTESASSLPVSRRHSGTARARFQVQRLRDMGSWTRAISRQQGMLCTSSGIPRQSRVATVTLLLVTSRGRRFQELRCRRELASPKAVVRHRRLRVDLRLSSLPVRHRAPRAVIGQEQTFANARIKSKTSTASSCAEASAGLAQPLAFGVHATAGTSGADLTVMQPVRLMP
jgi:hypothetical protein